MENRQKLQEKLDSIMKKTATTGMPHNKQSRELSGITAEILLEVIDSLNKIDETNKALDESNKGLARSNYRLQTIAVGIAIVSVMVAIFFGIITLQQKATTIIYQTPDITSQ